MTRASLRRAYAEMTADELGTLFVAALARDDYTEAQRISGHAPRCAAMVAHPDYTRAVGAMQRAGEVADLAARCADRLEGVETIDALLNVVGTRAVNLLSGALLDASASAGLSEETAGALLDVARAAVYDAIEFGRSASAEIRRRVEQDAVDSHAYFIAYCEQAGVDPDAVVAWRFAESRFPEAFRIAPDAHAVDDALAAALYESGHA